MASSKHENKMCRRRKCGCCAKPRRPRASELVPTALGLKSSLAPKARNGSAGLCIGGLGLGLSVGSVAPSHQEQADGWDGNLIEYHTLQESLWSTGLQAPTQSTDRATDASNHHPPDHHIVSILREQHAAMHRSCPTRRLILQAQNIHTQPPQERSISRSERIRICLRDPIDRH